MGQRLCRVLASAGLGAAVFVGMTLATSSGASASSIASLPRIIAVHLSPSLLQATGGETAVTLDTSNASSCQLTLVNHPSLRVSFHRPAVACTSGKTTFRLELGSNAEAIRIPVKFRIIVKTATEQAIRVFVVTVATAVNSSGAAASTIATAAPTATLSINVPSLSSNGGTAVLTYSSTNASVCTLASTPGLWSGTDPSTVGCNGTFQSPVPSTTAARNWTFTFTASNAAGQSATATQALSQSAPSSAATTPLLQSPNWSGFIAPSATVVGSVSGDWTVPSLNCSDTPNGGASAWAGTGGAGTSTGDLLQTGISDTCINGVQQNFAWWEEVPNIPNRADEFAYLPISVGDVIQAQVYLASGGQWVTRIDDLTIGLSGWMVTGEGWGVGADSGTTFTPQGSTANLTYSGGYTAEWIVEDYENVGVGGSLAPFGNFGSVTFTDLSTMISGWALGSSVGTEIFQNDVALAVPTATGQNSFTVNYTGP